MLTSQRVVQICLFMVSAIALSGGALLEGMEKQTILKTLSEAGGHYQRTAEMLGISRRTLSRKLRMYERDLTPFDYQRPEGVL